MIEAFDRVLVGVPDLARGVDDYSRLLGLTPVEQNNSAWFALANTVIELRQGPAGIRGLVLRGPGAQGSLDNPRGLDLHVESGAATVHLERDSTGLRVDHLVLYTADAGACVELFRDRLGIRLALDRTVPEWGGRMLFFRAGKLTLEVIEPGKDAPVQDYFWGIAYQCPDLDRELLRLGRAGVETSAARDGRKPGTRVASVRSCDLGIPTLLVEPAPAVI